ncbi:MAG: exo-alpha-sialidase [Planctomycetota bacterium]
MRLRRAFLAAIGGVLLSVACAGEEGYSFSFRTEEGLELAGAQMVRRFHKIAQKPDAKVSWKDPSYRKWNGKDAGYGYFGNMVRLGDGTLAAVFLEQPAEHDHYDRDYMRMVCSRSGDGGRTWDQPNVLFEPINKSRAYPCALADGSMILGPLVIGEKRVFQRSADLGRTWEVYVEIPSDAGAGRAMCQMSNGEILFLSSMSDDVDGGRAVTVYDPGTGRWQRLSATVLGHQWDEWWVTETKRPGRLVALMRDQSQSRYFSLGLSDDYGRTWHSYRPSDVWFGQIPNHPFVTTLPDGTVMAVAGERSNARIVAIPSFDDGETFEWSRRITVCDSPNEFFMNTDMAYPDARLSRGEKWFVRYYAASVRDTAKEFGVWGNFIDTSYFRQPYDGVKLAMEEGADTGAANACWSFDDEDSDVAQEPTHSSYGLVYEAKRASGLFGKCMVFSKPESRIEVCDSPGVRVGNFFTIEFFIRLAKQGGEGDEERTVIAKKPFYWVLVKGGKVIFRQGVPRSEQATVPVHEVASTSGLAPGEWQHVAVTIGIDPNGYNYLRLYVGGRKEAEYMISNEVLGRGIEAPEKARYYVDWKPDAGPMHVEDFRRMVDKMYMGGIPGETPSFLGSLDEVVFHRRNLRPKEIARRVERGYSVEKAGTVTSPVIEKPFGKTWGSLRFSAETPEKTWAAVDIVDAQGGVLLADVKDGQDLTTLTAEAVRLRGRLSTLEKHVTPVLKGWGISWK